MKILIQFPTKGRTEKFFNTLDRYYSLISDIDNVMFHIVIDHFDYSMNNSTTLNKLASYKNLDVSAMISEPTKIKACNYKIDRFSNFDILLLASDDMIPQIKGFDDIIRFNIMSFCPSLDGVLWFYDGYQDRICTLSIMGKKYYDRFKYIYHPSYASMCCDDEFTDVAKKLNRMFKINECIIKHEHPLNNKEIPTDETYISNGDGASDKEIYEKRRLINFGLNV